MSFERAAGVARGCMPIKTCRTCSKALEIGEFWPDPKKSMGVKSSCKTCDRKRLAERASKVRSVPLERERLNVSQRDRKARQIAKGLCRDCNRPPMAGKNTCLHHSVAYIAVNALGSGKKHIVDELVRRIEANPYCPYTGDYIEIGVNAHLDHIKPRSRFPELAGDINNVEWVSSKVNRSKTDMTKDEYISLCSKIHKKLGSPESHARADMTGGCSSQAGNFDLLRNE